ncbi:putative polysaccharide biosynthesis protein [Schnuerera ultunensis]|uniref:Stage V sporulation protein B n=1 Tax=[Clostridium] ultunense Esp TaxID=1288971 RepID=A0A1M4PKZ1_9FIRM|nr:oligosaccharide flippase family protein [Schnuerera ultunensis]SHD76126.1 Stage V sporulation protein B [[Clostridium] ultunense Esp]
MRKKGFVYGSILLVLVNFIIQIINFAYDVMLSKFLGAEAMGLFQMAMSILMIFLIFSTVGIPTAVSRLVAEQNSQKNHYAIEKTLKVALILTLFLSIIFSLIIILFSENIALRVFRDKKMVSALYLLIPAIVVISISSVLRGYYYGLKLIMVPSISQIIEHVTRFVIVLGFLYYICPVEPIYGAFIAIAGIAIGEIFDLIWLIYMLKPWKRKNQYIKPNKIYINTILRQILPIAMPIGISGLLNVILRFINSILIPQNLMKIGYTNREAVATFGRITGMTMPLIMLPFIVTSAMVINLVPNLSEQMALKNYRNVRHNIIFSIKITLMAAIPLTGLYIFFSEPLGFYLYGDLKVGQFINLMACGTIFKALQHTFSGILNGLKKHMIVTLNRLLGMVIQVLTIYYLVGNPWFGINGFFIGFLLSGIVTFVLDTIAIRKVIKLKIDCVDIIFKPLLATAIMVLIIYNGIELLYGYGSNNVWAFLFSLIIGVSAYIFVLYITKAIPKNSFRKLIEG